MTTHADQNADEEQELVRQLFFLMTTLCEDAATIAATGQAPILQDTHVRDLADRLHSTGRALMIIADAARTLASLPR